MEAFTDVEQYLGRCRFSDCQHETEPGCAIKEAIDQGELPKERWTSYLKIKEEARFVENKSDYLRAKKEWGKSIAVHNRKMKH